MTHTRRFLGSRLAQTGALVGALMLLMGTNDDNGCAPDPGNQGECTTASDCSGDPGVDCVGSWACNAGECTFECGSEPQGCYGDQDCSGGLVCNAAEVCMSPPGCQPGQPCPAVCYGFCVEPDPPPTGCYSDGQCGAGEHCSVSDGDCQTPPGCTAGGDCPAVCYGECVPNETENFCYSDQDCGPGTHCSVSDGVCDAPPGCSAGQPCPDVCTGQCVPNQGGECWSDNDCGAGEQCNTWDYCNWGGAAEYDDAGAPADYACMGMCEPVVSTCDSDDDCAANEYCGCALPPMADGLVACLLQCLPDPNPQCSADVPCPAGMTCKDGECVEDQKGCWSDQDCGQGEQCNTWDYCGVPYDCAGGADCLIACQGMCEPKPHEGCNADSECAAGQHCEVTCLTVDCDCDPSWANCNCPEDYCEGTCVDDDPWQGCSSDDDCGANEYCGCGYGPYPGMPNGIVCALQCMPKPYECSSDSDCESGQCNLEVCEAIDCDSDGNAWDCGSGEACWGYCEPETKPYDCSSNADCASGVCEFVVCAGGAAADPMPCEPDEAGNCAQPPPPEECWGYCTDPGPMECGPNGECPDGYTCGCGTPNYPAAGDPAGIMCYPMCIPDEPACSNNYDCAAGQACVNGVCVMADGQCESDADCGYGQHCEPTPCPAMPCTYDPATGESWCPPCYGQCVDDPTGGDCSKDADCVEGQFCAVDYCVTACPSCIPGAECPPCETHCFGTCKDQEWPQECNTNADCDAGESCQCTSNPACPECDACFFQCLPDNNTGECSSDSDCGDGQACDFICAPCAQPEDPNVPVDCPCFGMCVDKPDPTLPCDDDGSCPDGMACECVPSCPDCADCVAAQCVPVEPPAECQSNADCDEGYYCEQGPCPYFMPCSAEEGCPGCGGTCKPTETEPNPCMRTGCSGQVCAAEPVYTTCEWLPQYACYELAECGLTADGTCGWKGNDAFSACLNGQ